MKTLLIVDVQNDFCPSGSLAVARGAEIIPNINALIQSNKFDLIVASKDWHPKNHVSFASYWGKNPFTQMNGEILWPDHCVQKTFGAELHPDLDQSNISYVVHKGKTPTMDCYSAFREIPTKLSALLMGAEIYVCGIATDFCVKATAADARTFATDTVYVIQDACAAVTPEGETQAIKELKNIGCYIVTTKDATL